MNMHMYMYRYMYMCMYMFMYIFIYIYIYVYVITGSLRQIKHSFSNATYCRYPECRGAVFRPSYADDGSFQDVQPNSALLSKPPHGLRLERARGYHGSGFYPSTDTNAYFLEENLTRPPKGVFPSGSTGGSGGGSGEGHCEVVYPTAALVVMQRFPVEDKKRDFSSTGEEGGQGGGGSMQQRFFDGHGDDVTAVAVHPGGKIIASGQVMLMLMWVGWGVV